MNIVPPQTSQPSTAGFYGNPLISPVTGALNSALSIPGLVLNAVPQTLGAMPKAVDAAAQLPGAAVQAVKSALPQQGQQGGLGGFYGRPSGGSGDSGSGWAAAPYVPLSQRTPQP